MMSTVDVVLLVTGILLFFCSLIFSILSKIEGEKTAAGRLLLATLIIPAPFLLLALVEFPGQEIVAWIVVGAFSSLAVLLSFPVRSGSPPKDSVPAGRFDERDAIFSRAALEPGSRNFNEYYKRRPENLEADNRFRDEPGLLSSRSREADPFAAVAAGFMTEEHLRFVTDGPVSAEKMQLDRSEITRYIRDWAKYLGAHSVGFALLKDTHLYTVGGRREWYGKPIENVH